MRTIRRPLSALACLALAGALIAGCGGDDGGIEGPSAGADTDPQTILDNSLGSDSETIESGVLELSLDIRSGATGAIKASLDGPFESNGDDQLPSLDFDVAIDAQTGGPRIAFEGNLTVTPDGAFVGYADEDYSLDQETFDLLQQSYQQSSQAQQDQSESGGSLSQFGIDASRWLKNLKNEGTEDIDGTETVHVSGEADVPRLSDDLGRIAQATGETVDQQGLAQLRNSVKSATIDVYADSSNSSLRRLDVNLELADPSSGGTDALSFSIGIADPNTDQDVEEPGDAQPLDDLLGQIPGLAESLGGVAGGTGAGSSGAGSSGAGSSGAGSAPAPAIPPRTTEKYYDCVAAAKSPQDVEDCQKILG